MQKQQFLLLLLSVLLVISGVGGQTCSSSPCRNGATCVEGTGSYTCNCISGYGGLQCQSNIDECASSPCLNGGTCTDGTNRYECACVPSGYNFNPPNCNGCAPYPFLNEEAPNYNAATNTKPSFATNVAISESYRFAMSDQSVTNVVRRLIWYAPYTTGIGAAGTEPFSLSKVLVCPTTSCNTAFRGYDDLIAWQSVTPAMVLIYEPFDGVFVNTFNITNPEPAGTFGSAMVKTGEYLLILAASQHNLHVYSRNSTNGWSTWTHVNFFHFQGSATSSPSYLSIDSSVVAVMNTTTLTVISCSVPGCVITDAVSFLTESSTPTSSVVGNQIVVGRTALPGAGPVANTGGAEIYTLDPTSYRVINSSYVYPPNAPAGTFCNVQPGVSNNTFLMTCGWNVGNVPGVNSGAVLRYMRDRSNPSRWIYDKLYHPKCVPTYGSVVVGTTRIGIANNGYFIVGYGYTVGGLSRGVSLTYYSMCVYDSCLNGGTCYDNGDFATFNCTCVPGYSGMYCQTDINECASDPCTNGGTCVDRVNSHECICVAGYSGLLCQTDVNDCASQPCLNGGSCTDLLNGFTCACTTGFSGAHCQTNVNECTSLPCENGGSCVDGTASYSCLCVAGFSGINCQTQINECASQPCRLGSTCTDSVNGFSCMCVAGYSGLLCETDINECASQPCVNSVSCTDSLNGFTCTCLPGYSGVLCETDIDECASQPCLNAGTCASLVNGFTCTCVPGYSGLTCASNIDECASQPCLNSGTCADGVLSFMCNCPPGFSGLFCQTNINECASFPCQNVATCGDGVNGFNCTCRPGYAGSLCEIKPIMTVVAPTYIRANAVVTVTFTLTTAAGVPVAGAGILQRWIAVPQGTIYFQTTSNTNSQGQIVRNVAAATGATSTEYYWFGILAATALESNRKTEYIVGVLPSNITFVSANNSVLVPSLSLTAICGIAGSVTAQLTDYDGTVPAALTNQFVSITIADLPPCYSFTSADGTFSCAYASFGSTAVAVSPVVLGNFDGVGSYSAVANQSITWSVATASLSTPVVISLQPVTCRSLLFSSILTPALFNYTVTFFVTSPWGSVIALTGTTNSSGFASAELTNSDVMPNGTYTVQTQTIVEGCTQNSTSEATTAVNCIDYCGLVPCLNSGTCVGFSGGYTCVCVGGYSGLTCATDVDECASAPCQNSGTCHDSVNGFSCTCMPGYTGRLCQTAVRECLSLPCLHGGTCSDAINGFVCACTPGYSGFTCETNINECASQPCANGGSCTDSPNGFTCTCAPGYSGVLCPTDINECASSPCRSGGTCHDMVNGFMCLCSGGYSGLLCQTNVNECTSQPCRNGGTCLDSIGSYSCACMSAYSGAQCQTDINECASSPCQDGATCVDGLGSFACMCPLGHRLGANNITCAPCVPGYFNAIQSGPCLPCPPGRYSTHNASIGCVECDIDTFNPYYGSEACINCTVGTYASDTGATSCRTLELVSSSSAPNEDALVVSSSTGNVADSSSSSSSGLETRYIVAICVGVAVAAVIVAASIVSSVTATATAVSAVRTPAAIRLEETRPIRETENEDNDDDGDDDPDDYDRDL